MDNHELFWHIDAQPMVHAGLRLWSDRDSSLCGALGGGRRATREEG